ncbi:2-dehydropantoate 2-reductase [Bacillus rubiinfantis]|uniref:2-dehydropantoate 2-reductase n=1 Tax=Bacillus rubiinfantis TaxID=1499680 RepID=UPI0005A6628A|nr:2-dehydropantoate 2-reductase [Bacillus rubiinfantis]
MKVGIIGAGSIGLLFAAYLSRKFAVTIYTRSEQQALQINQAGILLKNDYGINKEMVHACQAEMWRGSEDITIVAVKQYQLNPIITVIKQLPVKPINLLFLQNGMGHLNELSSIQGHNVYVGSVEHGALRETAYLVSHNGAGVTNVAVYQGNAGPLREFVSAAADDFPFKYHVDYYEMLVKKLIVNSVINPLTAILAVKNGDLIHNHYYYAAAKSLFSEVAAILKLKNEAEYFRQVTDICLATAENHSSMLKDLQANRRTEIDAIVGYLLTEARQHQIKAPIIENLYNLIKGKEAGEGGMA